MQHICGALSHHLHAWAAPQFLMESASNESHHHGISCVTKEKTFVCASHKNQDNIIILDDSDDEQYMPNGDQNMDVVGNEADQNMDVVGNEADDSKQRASGLLYVQKPMIQNGDVCDYHVLAAKESSGFEAENVENVSSHESKAVSGVHGSDCGWCECKKRTSVSHQISAVTEQNPVMEINSCTAAVHPDPREMSPRDFKLRKKCVIDKRLLPLLGLEENNAEVNAFNATLNATVTVKKAILSKLVEAKPRMWESGIVCDLCRKGPCLSLGEWYAWCCGLQLGSCDCSLAVKMRLTLALTSKKTNRVRKMDGILWSGKVHKMCGLWSSEVYEEGEGLQGIYDAVKRGKLLVCAACREYGATLGCRVKLCRRSFHYPCADEFASKLRCRMWDGVQHPVACQSHRHVPETCTKAKERPPNLKKWRFRGHISRKPRSLAVETILKADQDKSLSRSALKEQSRGVLCSLQPTIADSSAKEMFVGIPDSVIDISTDSESENKKSGVQCIRGGSGDSATVVPTKLSDVMLKEFQLDILEMGQCWPKNALVPLYHMGNNLLCEDISCGREAVLIPCTNDVDSDPAPVVNYIVENRYFGRAKLILESVLLDKTRAAPSCNGCNIHNIDDPITEPSVHAALNNSQRESDTRFDWQGQSMLGRLPYDRFGRLQLGPDTKDILECNSRCPCGVDCLNKELQRGVRLPLEIFKTKDRGWGVRTMEQICRGKFVVEYIGEVLTNDEAHARGLQYDTSNFSCLFSADHPDVPTEDLLVIDGFSMSNLARFINHSCDGNLRVYRVYTETADLRFCRIGLFASCDIEIGEELTYDYSYVNCKETDKGDRSTDPTSIKCMCGASNCRKWLWAGTSQ